jgi:hypothetical protein
VRPIHLRGGTLKDNTADKIRKGRANHPKGERSPNSKLDEEKIREIRRLSSEGKLKKYQIGNLFGISYQQVTSICKRRAWAHVK